MLSATIYHSRADSGDWLQRQSPVPFAPDRDEREMGLVSVYRDLPRQEVHGFGGAFTPSSAELFAAMPPPVQEEALELLFGPGGLNFNSGRVALGACDFSRGGYTYCDQEDPALGSFSIAEDEKAVIPFLLAAKKHRDAPLKLVASPWSPPAWMKSNGNLMGGGRLLPGHYGTWARYLTKALLAYRERGIDFHYLSVQNEPMAAQLWESCVYTAGEERDFALQHLAPALEQAGLEETGILIWDHNKEHLFERARAILTDQEARRRIRGLAFHWYSGDHFQNLALCREHFPEQELIFTEGCVELSPLANTSMAEKAGEGSPWGFGECYGHDIIGNFEAGMNRFVDWNLILDQQGGPNHVGNYCSAPMIYDMKEQALLPQPSFCFISHFSRFVPPGSRVVAHSSYNAALEICAFETPGETVVVVMNPTDRKIAYTLKDVEAGELLERRAAAHSIDTICYTQRT